MPKTSPSEDEVILEGKIYAVIGYLSVLCVVPLVIKKDNPFVLSHGKQGLVLFVAQVALFIIHIVLPVLLNVGLFLLGVFSLWGIIEALRGHYVRLPFVADLADKISL